jgi:hypothetical protein
MWAIRHGIISEIGRCSDTPHPLGLRSYRSAVTVLLELPELLEQYRSSYGVIHNYGHAKEASEE